MDAFVEYLISDLLAPAGPVRAKRMFGGYGIYLDDTMYGLVQEGELFIKKTAANASILNDEDSRPFTYTRQGKTVALGYWSLPDALVEDREAASALFLAASRDD